MHRLIEILMLILFSMLTGPSGDKQVARKPIDEAHLLEAQDVLRDIVTPVNYQMSWTPGLPTIYRGRDSPNPEARIHIPRSVGYVDKELISQFRKRFGPPKILYPASDRSPGLPGDGYWWRAVTPSGLRLGGWLVVSASSGTVYVVRSAKGKPEALSSIGEPTLLVCGNIARKRLEALLRSE